MIYWCHVFLLYFFSFFIDYSIYPGHSWLGRIPFPSIHCNCPWHFGNLIILIIKQSLSTFFCTILCIFTCSIDLFSHLPQTVLSKYRVSIIETPSSGDGDFSAILPEYHIAPESKPWPKDSRVLKGCKASATWRDGGVGSHGSSPPYKHRSSPACARQIACIRAEK